MKATGESLRRIPTLGRTEGLKLLPTLITVVFCPILVMKCTIVLLLAAGLSPWLAGLVVMVGLLAICLAWNIVRASLGKFRRGGERAEAEFGWARGMDFGSHIAAIIAAWSLIAQASGVSPILIFPITLVLIVLMGRWISWLGRWVREAPKAKPLPAGVASVWDRELDG